MPPAESYVVSSTPPESIDFTHRFPRRSKILKLIQNLTTALNAMGQSDIELFGTDAKARTILMGLLDAVESVVAITKPREGKRSAH
ncbi:hypothetical protein R75471_01669 [Paraburkholderia domus]|nr:hypothetical protein R75471_01669 [Paraburkholderia domus]